jgi:hypothetical protein
MAATEESLSKVDSLVEEPKAGDVKTKRRPSSMAADVYNIEELGESYLLTACPLDAGLRMRGPSPRS